MTPSGCAERRWIASPPRRPRAARLPRKRRGARRTSACASPSLTLNADDRVAFVKRVQTVLKQGRCYEGAINGRAGETQDEVDRFVATTSKKGRSRPTHIELAKATASDFEAWLRDAAEVTGDVCAPKPKPPKPEVAKPARQRARHGRRGSARKLPARGLSGAKHASRRARVVAAARASALAAAATEIVACK